MRVSAGIFLLSEERSVLGVFRFSAILDRALRLSSSGRIGRCCFRLNRICSSNDRALDSQGGSLLPSRLLPTHRKQQFTNSPGYRSTGSADAVDGRIVVECGVWSEYGMPRCSCL
jgi:hypothetical protein